VYKGVLRPSTINNTRGLLNFVAECLETLVPWAFLGNLRWAFLREFPFAHPHLYEKSIGNEVQGAGL